METILYSENDHYYSINMIQLAESIITGKTLKVKPFHGKITVVREYSLAGSTSFDLAAVEDMETLEADELIFKTICEDGKELKVDQVQIGSRFRSCITFYSNHQVWSLLCRQKNGRRFLDTLIEIATREKVKKLPIVVEGLDHYLNSEDKMKYAEFMKLFEK